MAPPIASGIRARSAIVALAATGVTAGCVAPNAAPGASRTREAVPGAANPDAGISDHSGAAATPVSTAPTLPAFEERVREDALPGEGGVIDIQVDGITASEGVVRIGLYRAEGWLTRDGVVDGRSVPPQASVHARLEHVPPGRYAVSVFHDLNNDENLNANALGLPAEPFAFSRDARPMFGPPQFNAAAFRIKDGAEVTLRITLLQVK